MRQMTWGAEELVDVEREKARRETYHCDKVLLVVKEEKSKVL